ncbi:uncharacterized protein LOC141881304 [Acropora palmata]|uniref:uncharacterized protein LOC141881304 n=1 Tax=Acropora palmata TaxID=6131 RepID=UPI003DA16BDC
MDLLMKMLSNLNQVLPKVPAPKYLQLESKATCFANEIAAVVFLIVERAYTRRATIGSKIRPPSAGRFVKAVVNSNYQGIALCDGRNSRENGTIFTLVRLGNSAICIQFGEFALKAKNDTGEKEVVFETQNCTENPSSQFLFQMKDIGNNVYTWESSYLNKMCLGCSAKGQARLGLFHCTAQKRRPKLQFSITYKK